MHCYFTSLEPLLAYFKAISFEKITFVLIMEKESSIGQVNQFISEITVIQDNLKITQDNTNNKIIIIKTFYKCLAKQVIAMKRYHYRHSFQGHYHMVRLNSLKCNMKL